MTQTRLAKTPKRNNWHAEHISDIEYIRFKYKQKAKELHPDKGGDPEAFKELQEAFTTLGKRAKGGLI